MINLEKEIRQQGTVLAGVGAANSETVKAIAAAAKAHAIDQIVFAARGTSDHAAIYAQYLFHRYTGIPCSLATPSVVTKYGAHMHYEHALVIGISQSGCAQDVLSVLQDAKQSGAITATLTNNPDSPLAHGADFHLYCNAGPERSIAATKTFTSQMYALAMLCEAFCGDAEITEMLRRLPKMTEELMQTVPVQIEKIIARYRYLEDAFVLGRGMAYPIALEGALKILETNKIRVRGYASSDFHHGPMAQLSSKTLAIVLAPAGQTQDDAIEMLEKARTTGAETLVITDDGTLGEKYPLCIVVPSMKNDVAAPFMLAIALQFFALKLTEVKGIDPDQSAVLKKITITK